MPYNLKRHQYRSDYHQQRPASQSDQSSYFQSAQLVPSHHLYLGILSARLLQRRSGRSALCQSLQDGRSALLPRSMLKHPLGQSNLLYLPRLQRQLRLYLKESQLGR